MATITKPSGFQFTIKDEDLGKWVEGKRARARKELSIAVGVLTVFVMFLLLVAGAGKAVECKQLCAASEVAGGLQ
jgi:hypothetical protein